MHSILIFMCGFVLGTAAGFILSALLDGLKEDDAAEHRNRHWRAHREEQ